MFSIARHISAFSCDDTRATGCGRNRVDRTIELGLRDVGHGARLQPVARQPGLV